MKTMTVLLGMALLPFVLKGQDDAKVLENKLSNVVVYTQGAQLIRKAEFTLPKGTSAWKANSLSPFIDPKSIQVSLKGDATILSVNHRLEYLNIQEDENTATELQRSMQDLNDSLAILNARLEVLQEIKSILALNKTLGSKESNTTVAELEAAVKLYNNEFQKVKDEELQIGLQKRVLNERLSVLRNQLHQIASRVEKAEGEILVKIYADASTKVILTISYYVKQAGWFPKYDIRVDEVAKPMLLTYKAEVFQNTGEEWKDVLLTFTNAPASETGVAPKLQTWRLSYDKYTTIINSIGNTGQIAGNVRSAQGEPLIGASIRVQGTTIGTVTDFNGNYVLTGPPDARFVEVSYTGYRDAVVAVQGSQTNAVLMDGVPLTEVEVIKFDRSSAVGTLAGATKKSENVPLPITVVEKTTSVEFIIDRPYTIPADGKALSIELQTAEIPASYRYYAVPKIRKAAYLHAYIVYPDQYTLLAGEANIYFENTYVGRSVIDIRSFTDTLNISLGVDRNIEIDRIKVTDAMTRKFIGTNVTENRVFDIKVKNNKSSDISLTIFDQIPVSAINSIEVKAEIPPDASLDPETGIVKWDMMLTAQKSFESRLAYEVKYPRGEAVLLE